MTTTTQTTRRQPRRICGPAHPMRLIEKRDVIEIWHDPSADEYYIYGVTMGGDPRIVPSLAMAREIAAN